MVSEVLKRAAERAGVTEEQAAALVREISKVTHGMANAGDVAIPQFSWSEENAFLLRAHFPGWEGLTRGEYNGTRAAVIWRGVCGYLLADGEFHEWEGEAWEHPKSSAEVTP